MQIIAGVVLATIMAYVYAAMFNEAIELYERGRDEESDSSCNHCSNIT